LTGCSAHAPATENLPSSAPAAPSADPGHEVLNQRLAIAAQVRAIAAKYGDNRQAAMNDPQIQKLMAKMNSLQK
jgi:hypothetical protein